MTEPLISPFWMRVGLAAAALVVAFCVVPPVVRAFEALRRLGVSERRVFLLAAIGLMLYGGAKHVQLSVQERPAWLNVQAFIPEDATNDYSRIEFHWSATADALVPADTPIELQFAERGTTNYQHLADAVYSDRSNSVDATSFALNPTCYVYRAVSSLVPGRIEVTDFAVVASETSRHVRVSFTAPTNLYEAVARVYARVKEVGRPFDEVGVIVSVHSNNSATIRGDFVSGARDREFLTVIEKDVPDTRGSTSP